MKKTTINIFSENIHPNRKIDEKLAIDTSRKLLEYYMSDSEVCDNSCLFGEDYHTISFDFLFTDSVKTHEINKEYRNKDYEADIITFSIFADGDEKFIFDGEINLGEIIISLDKVEKNAAEKGVEFLCELNFLMSHGIMHLLGFDHQTEKDYNFIIEAQNRALDSIKG